MLHPECDRAHQWISLELDDELSAFEGTLLQAHLAECRDCVTFQADTAMLTAELRVASLQPLERPVRVVGRRRRLSVRLAPAVAATALAAVGLGSILASLNLGDGFNPASAGRGQAAYNSTLTAGAVNQLRLEQFRSSSVVKRERLGPLSERRIGGPVVPNVPTRP